MLLTGHFLLSIFNNDPQVIALGYDRLKIVFFAYIFSLLYEVMSGYLRGFGISLVPAALTALGVCGIRIAPHAADHHDVLSGQSVRHGADDLHCPAVLPPGAQARRHGARTRPGRELISNNIVAALIERHGG